MYAARSCGTYFVMPKWAKGLRPGRTYIDIYKLFSAQELADADIQTIREKTDAALLFDAYREQENAPVAYKNNADIRGLENVLYMCPHCGTEFSMQVADGNTLRCTACGFAEESDKFGFLHNRSGVGEEVRYVSDWSRLIYGSLKKKLEQVPESTLTAKARFQMIDCEKNRFVEVGEGTVSLSPDAFVLKGALHGEAAELTVPIGSFASLPFCPGNYLEIQNGQDIYRCVPEDGRLVMKFINMVKIFYELHHQTELVKTT